MQKLKPLRKARLETAKSQWEVAKETGIAQSMLSLYERDLKEPSEDHKKILAKLYAKSFDELWLQEILK